MLKIQRRIIEKLENIVDIAERSLDTMDAIYRGEAKGEDFIKQAQKDFEQNFGNGEIERLCEEAYQIYASYENVKEQFEEEIEEQNKKDFGR